MTDRRAFLRFAASGLALAALGPRAAAAQAPLKIAMIGAGREGSALGALFVKAGHPVMFSSRRPDTLKDLVAGLGPLAPAGPVEQAGALGGVPGPLVPYPALQGSGKADPAPPPP